MKVQKGHTPRSEVCSRCWCKKVNTPHSGHAVHTVGVGAKKSNQCMQYTVHSGIVVYGGVDIVFGCKKVKPEDAVDAVRSGIVVYGGGDIVFGAKRSNQWTGTLCKCKKVNDESAKSHTPCSEVCSTQ